MTFLIHSKRLTLREFNQNDAPLVAKLCHNPNLHHMTLSLPYPYTIEMAQEWISHHQAWRENKQRFEWAIVHTQTQQLIGAIGLSYHPIHHHGELGYWIGEPYWNQGYATEASIMLVKWAFNHGYHRLFARHFRFNPASRQVMEKAGFTYEGTQIDHVFKNGSYHTLEVCSIINPRIKEDHENH
ncbi:MAG: GNAT family N-acetyltransferase [Erysipelotrichia bacterium]|jgi:RimJ/RimL family protein N-acetyltransferase|nr:GNAT family N-acetyltransferase [Erysipelotrichia bacterium]